MKIQHEFERERVCALIESKVRRKEFEIARGLVEELFRGEIRRIIAVRVVRLKKYIVVLRRIMQVLISLLFSVVLGLVFNINRAMNLLVIEMAILISILLMIAIEAVLKHRFEKSIERLNESYENAERSFSERILTGKDCYSGLREHENPLADS